jgi:glycerol-3-phosphate acyltransferase PlsY
MLDRTASRSPSAGDRVLRIVAAAGLGVDASVHVDLAGQYGGAPLGIGNLFLAAGAAAVVAALLVLLVRRGWAAAAAAVVAAGTLAAVVTYRYVDPGPVGPFQDLYEPVWYPLKVLSAVAEAVTVVAAVALLARHRSASDRLLNGARRARAPRRARPERRSRRPLPPG